MTEYHTDTTKFDGVKATCKDCCNSSARASYYKNKSKHRKANKIKADNNRDRNRELIFKLTGFTCEWCGFTHKSTAAFDWHHLNPSEKEHSIGNLMRRSNTKLLLEEIEKCVFLCKNCHFIEHERIREENNGT